MANCDITQDAMENQCVFAFDIVYISMIMHDYARLVYFLDWIIYIQMTAHLTVQYDQT